MKVKERIGTPTLFFDKQGRPHSASNDVAPRSPSGFGIYHALMRRACVGRVLRALQELVSGFTLVWGERGGACGPFGFSTLLETGVPFIKNGRRTGALRFFPELPERHVINVVR